MDAYALLDLEPEADREEIESSYRHLCRLYEPGRRDLSIQLLEGEWSEEERLALLDQINAAYGRIMSHLESDSPARLDDTLSDSLLESADAPMEYSGQELRRIREEKGIGLHEIYKRTQLPYKLFANIEQEKYAKLPEPGLLRWYVSVYAKLLGLDAKKAADEYMKRYRRWSNTQG